MKSPIKQHYGENLVDVYVWGAAPYIKAALELDADITVTVDRLGHRRVLSHNASLRPISKLPWPLSKVQAHHVHLTVTFDELGKRELGGKDISRMYEWRKVDSAISAFLTALEPNSTVRVSVL